MDKMKESLKDLKSVCCEADIDVTESGVSQMSYDEDYHCSKCGKTLNVKRVWENKVMYFKED